MIMFQSLQMNPAWSQKVAALMGQREQAALATQKQNSIDQQTQFDAIESRIHSDTAANDAQHQGFDQHMNDLDRQSQNEADVQREVSPWKGSDGTTYKLPTQYSNAWEGADGTYIMNNDAGYNPNKDPTLTNNTNWTPMEQTHN